MIFPESGELQRVLDEYRLPPLPEQDLDLDPDGDDYAALPRDLILGRFGAEDILLIEYVSLDDAKAYCQRDDTHGKDADGVWWFVRFDLT